MRDVRRRVRYRSLNLLDRYARLRAATKFRRGWRHPRAVPLTPSIHLEPDFGYDGEEAVKELVPLVREHTMVSFEKLVSLWQQVTYLDSCRIAGAFVECGVWKGGAIGMAAAAHLSSLGKPRRKIHLFDSFEGLPEPVAEFDGEKAVVYSGNRAQGRSKAIGECVGPIEDCRDLLERKLGYPAQLIEYHVGWFEDTVPRDAAGIGPIALLRLDGDWYESTKVCLDHLYGQVVPGGVVVVDDYGHWEGCRRAVDEFLERIDEPVLLGHIDYAGRYWVKHGVG